jgi:hypothetical protein
MSQASVRLTAEATRAALNNGAEPRHAPQHHVARHLLTSDLLTPTLPASILLSTSSAAAKTGSSISDQPD